MATYKIFPFPSQQGKYAGKYIIQNQQTKMCNWASSPRKVCAVVDGKAVQGWEIQTMLKSRSEYADAVREALDNAPVETAEIIKTNAIIGMYDL